MAMGPANVNFDVTITSKGETSCIIEHKIYNSINDILNLSINHVLSINWSNFVTLLNMFAGVKELNEKSKNKNGISFIFYFASIRLTMINSLFF